MKTQRKMPMAMQSPQLSSPASAGEKKALSPFRLFDLPQELRDKIYELVLASGVVQNLDEAPQCVECEHTLPTCRYVHETQLHPRGELPANLAVVCWQIRNETLRLYRNPATRERVLQRFWEPPRNALRERQIIVLQTPLNKSGSHIVISETWSSLGTLHLDFEFRCFLSGEEETSEVFCANDRMMRVGPDDRRKYAGVLAEGVAKLEQIRESCVRPFVVVTILSRMRECISRLLDLTGERLTWCRESRDAGDLVRFYGPKRSQSRNAS